IHELATHNELSNCWNEPLPVIGRVSAVEAKRQSVTTIALQPSVGALSFNGIPCLIEGHQVAEVVSRVAAESKRFGESSRHPAGQVALPVGDQLEIVWRPDPYLTGKKSIRKTVF